MSASSVHFLKMVVFLQFATKEVEIGQITMLNNKFGILYSRTSIIRTRWDLGK